MADFDALLSLGAETSGLLEAERAHERVATSAERMEKSVLAGERATKKASGSTAAAAQQSSGLRASYDAVRASVDPLYASSRRYEAALSQVRAAQQAGIVSQREASRVMALAERQYLGAAPALKAGASGMVNYGMAATQAGYQVQDFAIQVAGGQSAMTAFAQQAPQLLGAFGFAGKLALYGSLAGTAVAVTAAIVPHLIDAAGGAARLEGGIDDLSDALADYRATADQAAMSTADMEAKYGAAAGAMSTTLGILEDIAASEAQRAIDRVAESVSDLMSIKGGGDQRSGIAGFYDVDILLAFNDRQRDARRLARENSAIFLAAQRALADSTGDLDAQIAAMTDLVGASMTLAEMRGGVSAKEEEITKRLAETLALMHDQKAATSEVSGSADDLIAKYSRQRALAEAIAKFGEDSAQVEALKREAALQTVNELIDQRNLSDDVAVSVRDSAMAAYDAERGAQAAAVSLRDTEQAARALEQALASAAGFSASLDNQVRVMTAQIDAMRSGADASAAAMTENLRIRAEAERDALIAAGQSRDAAQEAYLADLDRIEAVSTLNGQLRAETAAQRAATKASKAGAKAARASEAAIERQRRVIEQLEWDADPIKRYNHELAELQELFAAGLSEDAYLHAVAQLNEGLRESPPLVDDLAGAWGDFVVSGAKDFDGFADTVRGSFERLIADLIATAARNQVVIGLGMSATGGGGGAAVSQAAAGASGGILNGIAGQAVSSIGGQAVSGALGIGSALSGVSAGAQAALGIGSYSSAGLLAVGQNAAAAAAAGAAPAMAAIGAALPAIGLAVGAAAVIADGFKTRKKLVDSGVSADLSFDGGSLDVDAESYRTIKRSRKGVLGIGKRSRTRTSSSRDAGLGREFEAALGGVYGSIMDAAADLGVAASAFDGFSHEFRVSLKGLSEAEKEAAISAALEQAGDSFAVMARGLRSVMRPGEDASDALMAMAASLSAVNATAGPLGHALAQVSIAGGSAARDLVEAFGGLEGYGSAVSGYMQTWLSEQERAEVTTRQLTAAMADLGVAMPRSRDQYRAMVEAADINTSAGRELYTTLIGMSDAFDQVLRPASELTDALSAGLADVSSPLLEAARAASASADEWLRAQEGLDDFVRGLTGASGDPRDLRARTQAAYSAAMGGDVSAIADFQASARSYLTAARGRAGSALEYQQTQAQIANQALQLQMMADGRADSATARAGGFTTQADLLDQIGASARDGQVDGVAIGQIEAIARAMGGEAYVAQFAGVRRAIEATARGLSTGQVAPGDAGRISDSLRDVSIAPPSVSGGAGQSQGGETQEALARIAAKIEQSGSQSQRLGQEEYLVLKRILDVFEQWDATGMPGERAA